MPLEIERKFLLRSDAWKDLTTQAIPMRQGYLKADEHSTVRVRVTGQAGFLTVKGPSVGAVRSEFEYAIPVDQALAMLELCALPIIAKTRYLVPFGGHLWEVDVFAGANEGLILAEIELETENESFLLPEWVGEERTGNDRYYNSSLARLPFSEW
jgi:adenylate cyclase